MSDGKTEALRGTYFSNKKTKKPKQKLPDAKKHQIVSFIKSGVRIFGYIFLPFDLATAVMILIVSELVGIFEELV